MGKAGRFVCIFVPMAMTIASLICLVLVFLGGQNKNSSVLRDLYFMKVDASNFTSNPDFNVIGGTDIDDKLLGLLGGAATSGNIKDFYTIHIWNYCDGDINDGVEQVLNCSPRKASFWFNPREVWGLQNTAADEHFPEALENGLKVYERISKWMFAAYAIAFWVTVAEIVVGIFAIFSRWGSFVTTIVSSASSLFILAAAITSTAMYGAFVGVVNTALRPYSMRASMSTQMLSVVWIGVAFSLGAGIFWLASTCCCSGKSDRKRTHVEKTPYTYERVASPYMGQTANHNDVPMNNMKPAAGAYEPFRQQGRV